MRTPLEISVDGNSSEKCGEDCPFLQLNWCGLFEEYPEPAVDKSGTLTEDDGYLRLPECLNIGL